MAISKEERSGAEFSDIVLEFMKKVFQNKYLLTEALVEQKVKELVLLASENRDILGLKIMDKNVSWNFTGLTRYHDDNSDPEVTAYNKLIDEKEESFALRKSDIWKKIYEIENKYVKKDQELLLKYEPDYGTRELRKIFQGFVEFLNSIESESESESEDENVENHRCYGYFKNYMSKEKINEFLEYIEILDDIDEIKYYKKYIKEYNIEERPLKEPVPESYEVNDLNGRPYSNIKITSLAKNQVLSYEHVNLEINCDIPEGVIINIKDGNLTINADIKKNVHISVNRIPQINFRYGLCKLVFDSIERTETGYEYQGCMMISGDDFKTKDGTIFFGTIEYPIPEPPMPELKGFVRINGDIDDTVTYDVKLGHIIHNHKKMLVLPRDEELNKLDFSMFCNVKKGWKPNLSIFRNLIHMYDINKLPTGVLDMPLSHRWPKKISPESYDHVAIDNDSPIIFSIIKTGNKELIELALSQVSNINHKDPKKGTLFYHAISLKRYDIAEMLIEKGADVDYCEPDEKFRSDSSLLCILAWWGDDEGLAIIAKHSKIMADVHFYNLNLLEIALINGRISCARILVNYGGLTEFWGSSNPGYIDRLESFAEHGKCKEEFLKIKQSYLETVKTKPVVKLRKI